MKDLENKTGNPCYNYNATTKSIGLEKQIEEAAEIEYSIKDGLLSNRERDISRSAYIKGTKSEAAKAFHQQGMYSEEEVKQLLNQCNCLSKSIEDFNEQEWFEQNKKK